MSWEETAFRRLFAAFEATDLREPSVLRAAARAAARDDYAAAISRLVESKDGPRR